MYHIVWSGLISLFYTNFMATDRIDRELNDIDYLFFLWQLKIVVKRFKIKVLQLFIIVILSCVIYYVILKFLLWKNTLLILL